MYELVKTRRSIRKYLQKEVEKDKIDVIIKSALMAPSSRSRRPWEYVVVTDREKLKELSACREHSAKFLEGAPLGIVVIADSSKSDVWVCDASIASTIIQLTAHSLGLGSCWIQVHNRFDKEGVSAEENVRKALDIPERHSVLCIIAIGYPDESKKPYEEENLPYEKVHYERYDKEDAE
ncbi:MAG TPA: nitroreductase family protein [Clostridia bacterium]|jgi:nitroreductase|nr:nitroreductase family protein [Clostridia bacterium]